MAAGASSLLVAELWRSRHLSLLLTPSQDSDSEADGEELIQAGTGPHSRREGHFLHNGAAHKLNGTLTSFLILKSVTYFSFLWYSWKSTKS